MEAVSIKVAHEDIELQKKAEEDAKRKQFKQDFSELEQFRA